ncbi:bile acid:sodium symporter [Chloropicon primus]|uniref:Bile acid:sodium symporter n=1 Tax=Chloropicon primus TaxID=1764295 RepID=A0A5B8MUM9_9CHLO|nr:bile acid:sodium symporter [Chloropicon primus]UPR03717.1 bile acid:sodium symporter [Chloropicon primus]|eukprot:QDZ24508.1 bile acid:sodium symporter [Chloropicon primus]
MELLTIALALFLVLVGFGLGTTLEPSSIRAAVKHPSGLICAACCQFGFMPLISYLLCNAFSLPKDVALGVILVGSSPGGSTSNLFTYWCRGNVALSIAASAFSTLAAFGLMPLALYLYGEEAYGIETKIPWVSLVISLLLCVVPCACGIGLRHKNTQGGCRGMMYWEWAEKVGSIAGGVFLAVAVVYGCVTNEELFTATDWKIWVCCGLQEPIGALLGFTLAAVTGLSIRDRCTIALETGVQASTLAIAVTELSFSDGRVKDRVMKGPLTYSLFYLFHSMWIVLLFRRLTSEEPQSVHHGGGVELTKAKAKAKATTTEDKGRV